jgi:thiamine-phosphate pyrophosphorylase
VACVEGGARLLQIRAKRASSAALLDLTQSILERTRGTETAVVVNDRADIARLAGASGVHVGQEDLPPSAVRGIVGASALVGLSTHTSDQIRHALNEPITYLAIGPVFGTVTKDTGYAAVGLGRVREAASAAGVRSLPVVAIGGITLERAPTVLAAGAISVAVASDLLADGDPRQRVKKYLDRLAG